jgi:hypothetical protein
MRESRFVQLVAVQFLPGKRYRRVDATAVPGCARYAQPHEFIQCSDLARVMH